MKKASAPLPTLSFAAWLRAMEVSRSTGAGMDVACGDCRGCCTSSYFIPIESDEAETLARIPKRLLFPAPGKPKGRRLLGYDETGHCALFKDNACSIYAHRPRACRAYDCRVFAATGLSEAEKPAIASQAGRWRFALPTEEDKHLLAAVRAAARFLHDRAADFPEGFLPSQATQMAALALRIHPMFLGKRSGVAEKIAAILGLARQVQGRPAGKPPPAKRSIARKPPARKRGAGPGRAGSG